MPYTSITLLEARNTLASMLYLRSPVASQQFWVAAELDSILIEALRTWNAITSFWRASMTFATTQNEWWYDIPALPGSLRPYTVTDADLIQEIERALLEPVTPSYPLAWGGSAQFSISDIVGPLQRRRDDVLGETGCRITKALIPAPIALRADLSDAVVDVRRVAWLPDGTDYSVTPMRQSDDWAKRAFAPSWTVGPQAPPSTWSQSSQPPLSFDVDAVPPTPGRYEVLTVNSGPSLTDQSASILGIPDDWCWVVKYGALNDILDSESNAKDPLRSAYAQKRYEDGLAIMSTSPAVLAARVGNVPLSVDAVRSGDDFNASWQARAAGPPSSCYSAGLNLIGFGPKPDAGPYSVTLSVVQNFPIPTNQSDYIRVDRADYPSILDYAQHIAMFKAGGAEFAATIEQYRSFIRQASLYNSKLKELGQFSLPTYEISQIEAERNPVYSEPAPASIGQAES